MKIGFVIRKNHNIKRKVLISLKKNILSLTKYNKIESPNIVILTGGTNRIKDGLKIIQDFKNSKKQIDHIWNNEVIRKLRKKHIDKKLGNSLCKNCLTGSKDAYEKLTDLKVPENNKIKTIKAVQAEFQFISNNRA